MEHSGRLAQWLRDGAAELEISLDKSEITQFVQYFHELKKWNEKINLTAIKEDKEIVVKHFLDSLFCSKALHLDQHASMLDVGSGAGFPGLPLKIVNRGIELTLLEPSQKKTAFLRHIIGTLGLENVRAIPGKLQNLQAYPDYAGPFRYIVTRALSLTEILSFVPAVLAEDGQVVLCRAKPLDQKAKLYGLRLVKQIPYRLPLGYGERVLSVLAAS